MPISRISTSISYTINISVDPPSLWTSTPPPGASTGNFVYAPALLRVKAGDQITWTCDLPFALTFQEKTPVEDVELDGSLLTSGPHTVKDVKGQFHYAVAVWNGARIFLDASCPHISVN